MLLLEPPAREVSIGTALLASIRASPAVVLLVKHGMYRRAVVLVIALQVLLLLTRVLWVSTETLLLIPVSQLQLPVRVVNTGTEALV